MILFKQTHPSDSFKKKKLIHKNRGIYNTYQFFLAAVITSPL